MTQVGFNICEKGADMSYTDDSDNIRVTFYDNKSKVTQFNYMKNNYFDVIINILAIYNLK